MSEEKDLCYVFEAKKIYVSEIKLHDIIIVYERSSIECVIKIKERKKKGGIIVITNKDRYLFLSHDIVERVCPHSVPKT